MRHFTEIDAEQRSPAWYAARLGRLTGSRASDMLAGGKGVMRRNLLVQLKLERITGQSQEKSFTSDAIEDGINREPESFAAYEAMTGHMLSRSGFLSHNELMMGCSLDAHADDFGLIVEFKNPTPAVHDAYLMSGKVPGNYMKQCIHNILVSGAEQCDWVSYCPAFPEPLRFKVVSIKRSAVDLAGYEASALAFLADVDTEVNAMLTMVSGFTVLKETA